MFYSLINKYESFVLGAITLLLTPAITHACAVCVGSPDDLLSRGMNWSILFLMAMPFSVAGSIAGVLLYSKRQHARKQPDNSKRNNP